MSKDETIAQLRSQLTAEKQAHRECHAGMVTELEKWRVKCDTLTRNVGAVFIWCQTNDMSLPQSKERLKELENRLYAELDKGVKEDKR